MKRFSVFLFSLTAAVGSITQNPISQTVWREKLTKVKKRDGIHDLYFVFVGKGEGSDLFQFDNWQFYND